MLTRNNVRLSASTFGLSFMLYLSHLTIKDWDFECHGIPHYLPLFNAILEAFDISGFWEISDASSIHYVNRCDEWIQALAINIEFH